MSLPEIPVGTSFISRRALFDRGVHRQLQAGIAGGEHAGTEIDCRLWRLRGRRRLRNAGLMKSRVEGLPVRVVRGAHPGSAFARRRRRASQRNPVTRTYSRGARAAASGFRCGQVLLRFAFLHRAALPCGAGSSQRNRNGSFHSGSVGTEAHGATPIAQRGEVVASKMPHLFAAVY